MNQKGLIYSFVAKGTVVLAEHTSYSGNFSTIAVQCLQKLPSNSSKFTYSCDGHTFNFLVDNGFVFLVVADESVGRSVPFVFLERVLDDFKQRYGASIRKEGPHPLADADDDDELFEDRFSIAYNLDREFGPRLKEHMQYCMNHPEEISKLSKLKAQITEVKGIMMDNIEKVLDRGEKIELLVDKTENLQFQADSFQRQGRQLRRRMWLQNLQMKLMVGGAVVVLIILLWLFACGGKQPEGMKNEDWALLDRQTLGVIRLTLSRNVAFNITKENTTVGLMAALFINWRSLTEAALNLVLGATYYPTSPYPITYGNKDQLIIFIFIAKGPLGRASATERRRFRPPTVVVGKSNLLSKCSSSYPKHEPEAQNPKNLANRFRILVFYVCGCCGVVSVEVSVLMDLLLSWLDDVLFQKMVLGFVVLAFVILGTVDGSSVYCLQWFSMMVLSFLIPFSSGIYIARWEAVSGDFWDDPGYFGVMGSWLIGYPGMGIRRQIVFLDLSYAAGKQFFVTKAWLTQITLLALSYAVNDVPSKLSVIELGGLLQIALLDLSYTANDVP
ncbi:VAMP727 protein [Hibiscus syriacus]|uniref:VAMP727 protein n=1 Tax=Hibiscus syriacus TaxID=106335 RepID=A0A6A2XAF4_HIBSY|nr:VAMP727 protein [Hibiscus syriacus]